MNPHDSNLTVRMSTTAQTTDTDWLKSKFLDWLASGAVAFAGTVVAAIANAVFQPGLDNLFIYVVAALLIGLLGILLARRVWTREEIPGMPDTRVSCVPDRVYSSILSVSAIGLVGCLLIFLCFWPFALANISQVRPSGPPEVRFATPDNAGQERYGYLGLLVTVKKTSVVEKVQIRELRLHVTPVQVTDLRYFVVQHSNVEVPHEFHATLSNKSGVVVAEMGHEGKPVPAGTCIRLDSAEPTARIRIDFFGETGVYEVTPEIVLTDEAGGRERVVRADASTPIFVKPPRKPQEELEKK
jgi:hypothetical protein